MARTFMKPGPTRQSPEKGRDGVPAPNPFPLSVFDNIAYGPRTHGSKSHAELEDMWKKSLRHVELWEVLKDKLDHFALTRRSISSNAFASAACGRHPESAHGRTLLGPGPGRDFQIEELMAELKNITRS